MTESISIIRLSDDNNLAEATVIGHARFFRTDKFKRLSMGTHKRAQKSAPLRFGGNPIMTEHVSGAIHVHVQKNRRGGFQGFKIDPKKTLKKMSDKFTTEYANEDKMVQFFLLNSLNLEKRF